MNDVAVLMYNLGIFFSTALPEWLQCTPLTATPAFGEEQFRYSPPLTGVGDSSSDAERAQFFLSPTFLDSESGMPPWEDCRLLSCWCAHRPLVISVARGLPFA